jgi:hypothetical protein
MRMILGSAGACVGSGAVVGAGAAVAASAGVSAAGGGAGVGVPHAVTISIAASTRLVSINHRLFRSIVFPPSIIVLWILVSDTLPGYCSCHSPPFPGRHALDSRRRPAQASNKNALISHKRSASPEALLSTSVLLLASRYLTQVVVDRLASHT